MQSSRLLLIGSLLILALIGSIFLGNSVAQEDYKTLGIFLSILASLVFIQGFGRNIWLLIPLFMGFAGNTGLLPIPLSIANISALFAIAVLFIQLTLGMQQFHFRLNALDFWLFLCLLGMTITYFLNPVGLSSLNSDTIGSRPYFEVGFALAAYLSLASLTPQLKAVMRIPFYSITIALILTIGGAIAFHIPAVGVFLYLFYSGFAPHLGVQSEYGRQMALRLIYLRPLLSPLEYFGLLRPQAWKIGTIQPLITFTVLLFTLLFAMLTGHRIEVAAWGVYIILFCLIKRNMKLLFVGGFFGLAGLIGIYGFHHVVSPLPLSLQRSMSFLPGEWNKEVVEDAEGSIDWRTEMWEDFLGDNHYLNNPWLGDGFGFSKDQKDLLDKQKAEGSGALSPKEVQQYYLISGDLHSGPLSAVRFMGWIGLFLFTILFIVLAAHFWKLCRRSLGTPLEYPILFLSIPWIYFPFKYIFLYGHYANDFPHIIIAMGIYKLLDKTLTIYFSNLPVLGQEPLTTLEDQPILSLPS